MDLKNRLFWLLISWFWLICIIFLSLISIPKSIELISFPYIDKVEHAISYFLLMFLFAQCYTNIRTRYIYAAAFIGLGILLEISQSFTLTRQFEYADMLANTSGVIIGLIVADSFLREIVILVDNKINNFLPQRRKERKE